MKYRIELDDEQVQRVLLALQNPGFLRGPHARSGARIVAELRPYPPEPPNSSYRRTGTLGKRWTFVVRRSLFGMKTIVGNNTIYGPYVQSAERQAWMHKGRWITDAEALENNVDAITDDFLKTISKEIEKYL